jgi:hypothetical protein
MATRPQEVRDLMWKHIAADFGSVWFSSNKTNKGQTVHLDPLIASMLSNRRDKLNPASNDELVFISREGLPIDNGNFRRLWRIVLYVLSKYNDKRNKRNFCRASNFVVINIIGMYSLPSEPFDRDRYEAWFKNLDWDNISITDVSTSIFKVIESQCKLVGCSFYCVVQSEFVEGWFDTLLSSSVTDRRESSRDAPWNISRDDGRVRLPTVRFANEINLYSSISLA